MSLAEILLLFLFTFLVKQAADSSPKGPAEVAALRQQVARLVQDSVQRSHRIRELEELVAEKSATIDALSRMAGTTITSPTDVPIAVNALKRGYRMCRQPNTLLEAVAQDQRLRLVVLLEEPALQALITTRGAHANRGDTLNAEGAIDVLLEAVRSYGNSHQCRFDYRLRYATPEDYLLGREKLERYLYPEQRIQIGR